MNITLNPEQESSLHENKLAELRLKIASGTEQIAKGQVKDGQVVFAMLRDKLNKVC